MKYYRALYFFFRERNFDYLFIHTIYYGLFMYVLI